MTILITDNKTMESNLKRVLSKIETFLDDWPGQENRVFIEVAHLTGNISLLQDDDKQENKR